MSTQIKIKKLVPEASISKSKPDDAAFTITVTSKVVKDGYVEYGLGISSEIPVGWVGLVFQRSSVSDKDLSLTNAVGVIDPGYRGEWKARYKPTDRFSEAAGRLLPSLVTVTREYKVGEKAVQVIFLKLPEVELDFTDDELSATERGTGGFGSTGK